MEAVDDTVLAAIEDLAEWTHQLDDLRYRTRSETTLEALDTEVSADDLREVARIALVVADWKDQLELDSFARRTATRGPEALGRAIDRLQELAAA